MKLKSSSPQRIAAALKNKINQAMATRGLNENGHFRYPLAALDAASEVLYEFGIIIVDRMDIGHFPRSSGKRTVTVGRPNIVWWMHPINITNARLTFAWHKLGEHDYAVYAYLA